MKKFKLPLKSFNAILIVLLGVFGFSGCELIQTGRVEYGTPTADFKIKGAVVNVIDKEPIEGIQVKIIKRHIVDDKEYIVFQSESVTTDAKGSFEIIKKGFPSLPTLEAYFSDTKNSLFEDKIIEFDFKDADRTKPASGWFDGEFTKTINAELTPKKEDIAEE
ncbi:MAG: radical SAM-associated putative lipoprotein [Dysgonamonadaceae bacterium]|jgi:putative lipoprotein (rSAM/lipoprotein system)|nr:radical SAM-associated putative lipoprotein [Dysgonamonadaceae bacterium]